MAFNPKNTTRKVAIIDSLGNISSILDDINSLSARELRKATNSGSIVILPDNYDIDRELDENIVRKNEGEAGGASDEGDVSFAGGQTEESTINRLDPRTEERWRLQDQSNGVSGGTTLGISGEGEYQIKETFEQCIHHTKLHNPKNTTSYVKHNTNVKHIGVSLTRHNSSAQFGGAGAGGTGAYIEIPKEVFNGSSGGKDITKNVRVDFWMRYDTTPTADETILARRHGTGSHANDCWWINYDQSSDRINFSMSDESDTGAGFQHSTVVATGTGGAGGITVGQWHNVVVTHAYGPGASAAQTNVFWNGTRKNAITFGNTAGWLNKSIPVTVGADVSGYNPYSGYVDNLHIVAGITKNNILNGATGATYAYNTGTADSDGATLTTDTICLMTMNGISGGINFSMKSSNFGFGIVTGHDTTPLPGMLYGREVGVSGGATALGAYQNAGTGGVMQGFVVGQKSSAHWMIGATYPTLITLQRKKDFKNVYIDYVSEDIINVRVLAGATATSGASNDFLNLFGITSGSPVNQGNTFGVTGASGSSGDYSDIFSFRPSNDNILELNNYRNLVIENGNSAGGTTEYIIPDSIGRPINFAGQDVLNLYRDVMGFRSNTTTQSLITQNNITAQTTFNAITNTNLNDISLVKGQSYSTSQTQGEGGGK